MGIHQWMFSAYCITELTFCDGNPPMIGGLPHIGPAVWSVFPCGNITMYHVAITEFSDDK